MLETVAFCIGGRWHFLGTAKSKFAELAKGKGNGDIDKSVFSQHFSWQQLPQTAVALAWQSQFPGKRSQVLKRLYEVLQKEAPVLTHW